MAEKFNCVVQAWVTETTCICQVFETESHWQAMDRMDAFMTEQFPGLKITAKRAFSAKHNAMPEDNWKLPYGGLRDYPEKIISKL